MRFQISDFTFQIGTVAGLVLAIAVPLAAQAIDAKAAAAAIMRADRDFNQSVAGSWVRRTKTTDGKTTEARGQYATTWQKQKDGSWKVVYDIGSTAP